MIWNVNQDFPGRWHDNLGEIRPSGFSAPRLKVGSGVGRGKGHNTSGRFARKARSLGAISRMYPGAVARHSGLPLWMT
jgi:hypothetical protein